MPRRVQIALLALAALACDDRPKGTPSTPTPSSKTSAKATPPASASSRVARDPNKVRGGGKDEAAGARLTKQKAAAGLVARKDRGKKKTGSELGVECSADVEGLAFCPTERFALVCSGGTWYELDCPKAAPGSFCGYDTKTAEVDCWPAGMLSAAPTSSHQDTKDDDLDDRAVDELLSDAGS